LLCGSVIEKSYGNPMWWVVAIITVRAIFLAIEFFVHEADIVPHNPSWLPDSKKDESVSGCCDDGFC